MAEVVLASFNMALPDCETKVSSISDEIDVIIEEAFGPFRQALHEALEKLGSKLFPPTKGPPPGFHEETEPGCDYSITSCEMTHRLVCCPSKLHIRPA